jgi:uncharacterized protein YggE
MRISEDVQETVRPMAGRVAMAAGAPIEAGTRVLTVEVHVTYALR